MSNSKSGTGRQCMQPVPWTKLSRRSLCSQMTPTVLLSKISGCALSSYYVLIHCREEKKSMHTTQEKDRGKNTFPMSKQHKETTETLLLYFAEHNAPHSLTQRVGTRLPLPRCLRVPVSHLASSYQLRINSLGKSSGYAGFTC